MNGLAKANQVSLNEGPSQQTEVGCYCCHLQVQYSKTPSDIEKVTKTTRTTKVTI